MDYPDFGSRGKTTDPMRLESLGKQAAEYADSRGVAMTQAVVQTLNHEDLNPEQVRRVVEFANVEAFNRKFASMSGPLRAVHFDGGPADPIEVLQGLNDKARPKTAARRPMDYEMPPETTHTSMSWDDAVERTPRGILGDIHGLQDRLLAAHDEMVQVIESAKMAAHDALMDAVDHAKRAALQGAAPDEIFAAWSRVDPAMAKTAFSKVVLSPGVKTAGRRIDPSHPVVARFDDFVKAASVQRAYTTALRTLDSELGRVATWMSRHGG